jgi:imidazolonepropionase-like amidohydrolase
VPVRRGSFAALTAGVMLCATGVGGAGAASTAVVGATLHPVSGPVVPGGVLIMDAERIVAVGPGDEVAVPEGAVVVPAEGLHLWPGMIDAQSQIGLTEISSVRGTMDQLESGQINPNARAEVAVNASSSHIPVTRANGVLLAATVPGGSFVPGTAAVVALEGWTWEEMVRLAPAGLVVRWPDMGRANPAAQPETTKAGLPVWEERIARLDEMIREAAAYARARETGAERDADVRWESLRPVLSGEVPVWIQATRLVQIRAALEWTAKHGLAMVLVDGDNGTGGDAWRAAEELAKRHVPVIVQTTRLPVRVWEPYDTPFAAPARLHEAGVPIAFGSWHSAVSRSLPQEAARAAAFGLPREAAERALTLGAAELLGVADHYGSLEPGKSATMILVDGDLLETRMQVVRAWIDGRELDLTNRHSLLREKWAARPAAAPSETD